MPSTQTRHKRRLGQFLQRLRERSALTHRDVAEHLRRVQSSISKIENGYMLCSHSELVAMLALFEAAESERTEAEQMWEEARTSIKRIRHSSTFPHEYRTYIRSEAEASSVRVLATHVLPGLLQTPAYVRAINAAADRLVDELMLERAVAGKRSRQKRLSAPDPLKLHALVDEGAIRRVVGGAGVMRDQLRHLLERAAEEHITVQVVPFEMGAYAFSSGPMAILGFEDAADHDAIYLEHPVGGYWVRSRRTIEELAATFADVAAQAPTPEGSARIIGTAIERLEHDGQ